MVTEFVNTLDPHLEEAEDVIAEGDTVAVRLQWHGTLPSGKRIDRETIDILRFIAGQVVEHWGAEARREETEHGGGI